MRSKSEAKKGERGETHALRASPRLASRGGGGLPPPLSPHTVRHPTNRRRYPVPEPFVSFQEAPGAGPGVRERLRMSFNSAQRLARAAVLGGWEAALRVGLGSRALGAASVLLRGAGGNVMGCFGQWRRREGEEGTSGEGAARAFAVSSGDGGRRGGDVSRFRGRAGMGLGRWVRAGLYDVGRRIWRARLDEGRQWVLRCSESAHLRDGAEGYLGPIHLEPFLQSAC